MIEFFSKITAILLFIGLLTAACSNHDRKDNTAEPSTAKEKVVQLDPASATLYPSQKKAPAEDFSATLLNGQKFRLSEQRGKVVLINVWATWCAPCHEETPDFVDLYEKYKEEGLVILGVSIDEQGRSVVRPFMEKYNVSYPMVIDRGNITSKYGADMGVPSSYVIGPEGYLRYFAVGPLTARELEPRIQKLLREEQAEG